MKHKPNTHKPLGKETSSVLHKRVIRAVASSTAIETGESIDAIETRIRSGKSRFKDLQLA